MRDQEHHVDVPERSKLVCQWVQTRSAARQT